MEIKNKPLLLNRIKDLTHPLSPIPTAYDNKLTPLNGVRCIAFDFYGTMFISGVGDIGIDKNNKEESIGIIEQALRQSGFAIANKKAGKRAKKLFEQKIKSHKAAARRNGVDHPEADIRVIWKDVLQKLTAENYINGTLTEAEVQRFAIEYEFRMNEVWPFPGLASLLQSLVDSKQTLGIISNSQFYTPLTFEAFLGERPEAFGFESNLLVWSFKTGYKKPSQHFYSLFLQSARQRDISPKEILYIGNDLHKDIYPANALGMKTALFIGDKRSIRHEANEHKREQYKPDIIIDDLMQIQKCLAD